MDILKNIKSYTDECVKVWKSIYTDSLITSFAELYDEIKNHHLGDIDNAIANGVELGNKHISFKATMGYDEEDIDQAIINIYDTIFAGVLNRTENEKINGIEFSMPEIYNGKKYKRLPSLIYLHHGIAITGQAFSNYQKMVYAERNEFRNSFTDFTDVTNGGLFLGCLSLKYLDTSGWNFKNARQLGHWRNRVAWGIGLFRDCINLEFIPYKFDLPNAVQISMMFYNCRSLKKIQFGSLENVSAQIYGDIGKNGTTDAFTGCVSLEEFEIERSPKISWSLVDSTLLKRESLLNIIESLYDFWDDDYGDFVYSNYLSEQPILTIGPANMSKLFDDEKAAAVDKGWKLI